MNDNSLPIAALATSPSPEVSPRYNFFSTAEILESLFQKGFEYVGGSQKRAASQELAQYAGHTVRLRPPKQEPYTLGQLIPEITLSNAHKSGALTGHAGAFQCFCLNQCLRPVPYMSNACYFRHTKTHSLDDVIEGVFTVVDRSNEWVKQLTEWNKIPITQDDAIHMAEQALLLRWPAGNAPATPDKVLVPRYHEEAANTLGAVYNRLHNLAQHGLPKVAKGRVARALRNDSFLKFNQGLVEIAESMLQ